MMSWGLSVSLADAALDHLSAAELLLLEVLMGTLIVGILLAGRALGWRLGLLNIARPARAPWRTASLLGLLEPGAAYLLANAGLARTTAAVGSLLTSLESVLAVFLGWWILRDRLRRGEILALILGVLGAIAVSLADGGGEASLSGNILMVLAAATAAVYFIVSRQRTKGVDLLSLVFKQGIWALAIAVPYAAWSWADSGSRIPQAPPSAWAWALGAAATGFSIPFLLWSWSISRVRPAVAAVGLNLIPVFGVLGAVLIGRGAPNAAQLGGGLVILCGLAILTRTEFAKAPVNAKPETELTLSRG
ncbi:MAG: DMT family transporter [Angustibacter sp.]